jgi:magnesium-dependent phosphatase-1
MKLIALDGDDTLWQPLSGVNISDRTPTDEEGWPHFTYGPSSMGPLVIERDDGALFRLRPEAREVLQELKSRGLLTGVVSYNHEGNIRLALDAFGVGDLVDYVVAEWHTNKDQMLGKMIALARRDGHDISPGDVMLVDDDPNEIYSGQCSRMGAGFCRFGVDVHDLREVLEMPDD